MGAGRGNRIAAVTKPTLTHVDELVAAGFVAPEAAQTLEDVGARYAVAVNETVAALIDRTDPADPIARQFLPDAASSITTPEELRRSDRRRRR